MRIGRFLLVRVTTDGGVTGIGEAGCWGAYEAVEAMLHKLADYYVGQDPMRIEHHWQYVRRQSHYRGSVVMAALSAMDIALWDIRGRALDQPVWRLLSGGVRHRIRVYRHVMSPTKAGLEDGVRECRGAGYTAVGHLTPFLDSDRDKPFAGTSTAVLDDAVATIATYRNVAGPQMDLCIELHRRLSVPDAIRFAREIETFRPMFIEDPIRPDNMDAMAEVAARSPVPVATGERMTSPEEFAMLIERRACHYLRPSPGLCGGITGTMKIAALAEANGLQIVPHNPFSPVMTAVCAQISASVANLALQEYSGREDTGPRRDMVKAPLKVEGGYLEVPEGAGLGIELVDDPAAVWPFEPRRFVTRLHVDGSVVDQ